MTFIIIKFSNKAPSLLKYDGYSYYIYNFAKQSWAFIHMAKKNVMMIINKYMLKSFETFEEAMEYINEPQVQEH